MDCFLHNVAISPHESKTIRHFASGMILMIRRNIILYIALQHCRTPRPFGTAIAVESEVRAVTIRWMVVWG
jgi:hypothetical protein